MSTLLGASPNNRYEEDYQLDQIIKALREGRVIDAIKDFRSTYRDRYGNVCGLKEAKDAVEAIRSAMTIMPKTGYIVTRTDNHFETVTHRFDTEADAITYANQCVEHERTVVVAEIIAETQVIEKRILQRRAA